MSIVGALSGVSAIKKAIDAKNSGQDFGDESPFLSLKDGESAKFRFLQEVDDSFTTYDARRGLLVVVNEHSNPKDFRLKAVCTKDEDNPDSRCYGCERYIPGDDVLKKWRAKMRLYSNVLVRGVGGAEDRVKILSQGFGGKSCGNAIIEMALEFEGLGHSDYKLSRKGSGMNDTEYTIMPLAPKAMTKADEAFEIIDLGKFVKSIPYEEQAEFYNSEKDSEASKKDW